jgi:hypothetical protein
MGLIDHIKGLISTNKKKSPYPKGSTYRKRKCHICNQVCYNERDLELHLKYNHPDVASTPTS